MIHGARGDAEQPRFQRRVIDLDGADVADIDAPFVVRGDAFGQDAGHHGHRRALEIRDIDLDAAHLARVVETVVVARVEVFAVGRNRQAAIVARRNFLRVAEHGAAVVNEVLHRPFVGIARRGRQGAEQKTGEQRERRAGGGGERILQA